MFLPSNSQRQGSFDPFRGSNRNSGRSHIDEIEEAEYEDLSNKDN